jgi:AAA domain
LSLFETATREQSKLRMALQGASGSGKAQPVDRKVLTPAGWKKIGELVVGDHVVDPDGGLGKVEAVFPQGQKESFGVHFVDGSYTECCAEHLWLTQSVYERSDKKPGRVREMSEMMKSIHLGVTQEGKPRPNYYIPMVSQVDIGAQDLPVDPWLLGVIIGDGCLVSPGVTISKPGRAIREAVADCLPPDLKVSHDYDENTFGIVRVSDSGPNSMRNALDSLGLIGKKSIDKYIPDMYMFSSFQDRVSLLQGLLDTDGYICGHTVEYSTSSERLAWQARELVHSIGGTCSFKSRIPHYTHNGERRAGAENWRLFISLPNSVLPVRLQPKLGRYTPRTKYQPYRSISEVNTVGIKECVCIQVSTKRNLYITDDYIVTHNTKSALKIAEQFGTIALIDTERGSSRLYAGDPPTHHKFQLVEVMNPKIQKALPKPGFHPENAIFLMNMAAENADVVIIDSGSHFWNGSGGYLELVDDEVKRMQARGSKPDSFAAWKAIDPLYKKFVNAILNCPAHVIICLRAKQEYEKKDGKVIKLGMAPEFRDQFQFEMSIEGMLDAEHNLVIGKTRCEALDGRIFPKPGKEFADIVKNWLSDGAPASPKVAPVAAPTQVQSVVAAVESEFGPVTVTEDPLAAHKKAIAEAKTVEELKSAGATFRLLQAEDQKALALPYREAMTKLTA